MMAPLKPPVTDDDSERYEKDSSDEEEDVSGSDEDSKGQSGERSSDSDTTDEIAVAKRAKSKKTLKRKRRATEPSQFGATLESLLNTEVQSTLPLSLKPSVARRRRDEKLELKAKKVQRLEKKEREDKCRITDVIGGWGMSSERELRKVAQRGGKSFRLEVLKPEQAAYVYQVVRLFNLIQQSEVAASAAAENAKVSRGTGKPSLRAPEVDRKQKGQGKKRNTLGTAKDRTWQDQLQV